MKDTNKPRPILVIKIGTKGISTQYANDVLMSTTQYLDSLIPDSEYIKLVMFDHALSGIDVNILSISNLHEKELLSIKDSLLNIEKSIINNERLKKSEN